MLYYVMWAAEIIAVCSRAADAHAMAVSDPAAGKTYTVVAKMVDTV